MKLYEYTLLEAIEGFRKKVFSSVELVTSVLERIEIVDSRVKAYLTVDKDGVIKQAKEADKMLSQKPLTNSLLGIPFSLKDNICTKDLRTTAASKVLDKYIPVYDATISRRLKDAGAVIVGKTNMDAWAHGSSTETSDYFTTHNPWNLDRLPGGSSGGSAASIAADMTIGSIGTETAGSIRQPASWSGVVGFKPTYGRVSRYGIISMGSSLDSPGPMTKTVADAAYILNFIAGEDENDATSSKNKTEDYTKAIGKNIKNIKIGIASKYIEISQKGVQNKINETIKVFQKMGANISELTLLDPQYAISVYTILQRAEVSANLARYDGIRYGYGRDLFGDEAKRRVMLGTYALSTGYYDALYLKAQKIRSMIIADFQKVFKEVDVIIGPTSPCVALPIGSTKDAHMFGELQDVLVEPSTIAGLPGINVPCGFADGLPVGLQIIGPQFAESKIIEVADAYEKETKWYKLKPNIIG